METDLKQRLSAGEQNASLSQIDNLHSPMLYDTELRAIVDNIDSFLNQSNSLQKCQAKPTAVKEIIEGRMKEYQARMQRWVQFRLPMPTMTR